MSMMTQEIPSIGEYDVAVCGGGLAGFGAACAAAAAGAKTILIERQGMLGGLGAGGGVGNFSYSGGPPVGLGAIFDAIVDDLAALGAMGEQHGWHVTIDRQHDFVNHTFDHNMLPISLQRLAKRFGVSLLYSTDVVGARSEGCVVRQAIVHNRSLLQSVSARIFIDGTGDGILSRHAGGQALPVEGRVIKPSLMVFLRKTDAPVPQVVLDDDALLPPYSIWYEPRGRIAIKLKPFADEWDTATGQGFSDTEVLFRQQVLRAVRHFQQHHDATYVFDYAAPLLGLRESRRVEGDYVLNVADVRAGRRFDDSVAYGVFSLDDSGFSEIVPPYQIPYRSLLVKGLSNLLVVGRCFSADRLALSSTRVMPTGCLMGQAAGLAAALAAARGRALREIPAADIRQALLAGARDGDLMRQRLCP